LAAVYSNDTEPQVHAVAGCETDRAGMFNTVLAIRLDIGAVSLCFRIGRSLPLFVITCIRMLIIGDHAMPLIFIGALS
jgi:hypothetical protein